MKHNLLQKLAIALMLCFFFQNAQAQIDDGKFPDKLRPPMIDNIVIFNSNPNKYETVNLPSFYGIHSFLQPCRKASNGRR